MGKDKLSGGPCPLIEFVCVVQKLEKWGRGDRVSSDVRGDMSQSHRLRTAKYPHLTDEETEAQKKSNAPSVVSQPVRTEADPEPTSLELQPLSSFCSELIPNSLPRGLRENSLSFVLIGGSSTCPLLGLGNTLNCPLLRLVDACLAFALIGQFSATPHAKGKIMAQEGNWEGKLKTVGAAGRGPSGLEGSTAMKPWVVSA